MEDSPAQTFTILLGHNPDVATAASRMGIDLLLSGDTHGGQIVLPLVGPIITKTRIGTGLVYGLNRVGETWVYTNPGIGTTGLPFRFGSPPEATVLILRQPSSVPG
jgi:predicted MPP superfamily phosphohydrolase